MATTEIVKVRRTDQFYQHEQAIKFFRSDAVVFNRAREEAPVVDETVDDIAPLAQMSRSGALGWSFDTFCMLNKNSPSPSEMDDPLVRKLCRRLRKCERYPKLQIYTIANDIGSALATCSMTRELASKIPEDTKRKADAARKAEQEAQAMEESANAAKDSPDQTPEQKVEAEEQAREAREKARAASIALSNSIRTNGRQIASTVRTAVANAAEEVSAVQVACQTFGSGSIDATGGLPPAEKMRLAKLIQRSGPAFKKLLMLLGRLTAEAIQKQASKTRHEAGAINFASRIFSAGGSPPVASIEPDPKVWHATCTADTSSAAFATAVRTVDAICRPLVRMEFERAIDAARAFSRASRACSSASTFCSGVWSGESLAAFADSSIACASCSALRAASAFRLVSSGILDASSRVIEHVARADPMSFAIV
jgi:hypothetical protein